MKSSEVDIPGTRMRGGVLINKPCGISSFDVIRKLRKILPPSTRLGHTGTLDPAASGLLLVLAGEATRIQNLLKAHDKEYIAGVRLGLATDTLDQEGEVTEERDVPEIAKTRIEEVLVPLAGTRMQHPPLYSALKVKGRRAYKMARSGEEFELPAREVTIHSIELLSWENPHLKIKTRVSAGTYIRSLAQEIGQGLGLPASLGSLTRTRVGSLSLDDAHSLDNLDLVTINKAMIPIDVLLDRLPQGNVSDAESLMLLQGKPVKDGVSPDLLAAPLSLVFSPDRQRAFLCVSKGGALRSKRLLYNNGDADG